MAAMLGRHWPIAKHMHKLGIHLPGALVALAAVYLGWWAGRSTLPRYSDHRGFHLIAGDDAGPAATTGYVPPRRLYLVVLDGLGAGPAAGMVSLRRVAAAGQCRLTDVGLPSLSRPVYAALSTGLEQDRTGARDNDDASPLRAESVWQVARATGKRVLALSDTDWWRELWPDGYSRYELLPDEADFLARAAVADEDLVLVHHWVIDVTGHDHGGASPEYAAAVARSDHELGGFLDRFDFARDALIVTSDHGHTAAGGHGGGAPEVRMVETCVAGAGFRHAESGQPLVATDVAPLVALVARLRLPRHMRAADGEKLLAMLEAPAAYVADRRAALARTARAQQGVEKLYAAGRRRQAVRGALALTALAALYAALARARRLSASAVAPFLAWAGLLLGTHATTYIALRGSFDLSSVNEEKFWVRPALGLGVAVFGFFALAHGFHCRDARRLRGDLLTLLVLLVAAEYAWPAVYGWVLGFPVPGPALLFLPLHLCAGVVSCGLVTLCACLAPLGWCLRESATGAGLRRRRPGQRSRSTEPVRRMSLSTCDHGSGGRWRQASSSRRGGSQWARSAARSLRSSTASSWATPGSSWLSARAKAGLCAATAAAASRKRKARAMSICGVRDSRSQNAILRRVP